MSRCGMSSGRPEDEQQSTLSEEGRIKDFDFCSPETPASPTFPFSLAPVSLYSLSQINT